MAKRAGFGFGLTSNTNQALAQVGPAQDPVDKALVDAAHRISNAVAFKFLAQTGQADGGAPAVVPTTIQDQIALSREAREAANSAVELAKDSRDEERERRREAEDRAKTSFQDGYNKASNESKTVLEMFQAFTDQSHALLKESYQAQIDSTEKTHNATIEAINAKLDAALALRDHEIEQKERIIERQNSQLQELRNKRSWQEEMTEALISGDRNHPLVRAYIGTGQDPNAQDPNHVYQMTLAPKLAEAAAQKANAELTAMQEEERRKDEKHQVTLNLLNTATNALGAFFGSPMPTGLPQNGVPPNFPEGMGDPQ